MAAAGGGEDDSDMDLTYGEVEQRLDLLQQHLNRWEGVVHCSCLRVDDLQPGASEDGQTPDCGRVSIQGLQAKSAQ